MEIKTPLDIEYWTKFLESLDSDLKEKVKAFGIACLYIENHHCMVKPRTYEQVTIRDAFHELCKPQAQAKSTSLLTETQQDEIERARKVRRIIQDSTKCQSDFTPRDANDLYEISGILLRIIDNIQAPYLCESKKETH